MAIRGTRNQALGLATLGFFGGAAGEEPGGVGVA